MSKRIYDWSSPDPTSGGFIEVAEVGDVVGSGINVGAVEGVGPTPNMGDQVAPPDSTKPYWLWVVVGGTLDGTTPDATVELHIIDTNKMDTIVARETVKRTADTSDYLSTLQGILAPGDQWSIVGPSGYVTIVTAIERALA